MTVVVQKKSSVGEIKASVFWVKVGILFVADMLKNVCDQVQVVTIGLQHWYTLPSSVLPELSST
jgi:hypothetical protein